MTKNVFLSLFTELCDVNSPQRLLMQYITVSDDRLYFPSVIPVVVRGDGGEIRSWVKARPSLRSILPFILYEY